MNSHILLAGSALTLAALVGCASTPPQHMAGSAPVNGGYSNNGYSQPVANGGGYANVQYGTVERVDVIDSRKDSGVGALIGAGVGAVVGNQIGRNMNDAKTTGTVAGAVGGGLLGNAIERNQNKNNQVNRVYVRLDNGGTRYWEVPASQLNVATGARVRIENDQIYAN